MIAALDATPLMMLTSGGLARYVAELARALAREYPDDTYVLLSDQKFALPDGFACQFDRRARRTCSG